MSAGQLLTLGSATLGECGARRMRARIRTVWAGAAVAAPAYPVACAEGDNLAVHVGVVRAPAGSVLVADCRAGELGFWGEVLTVAAQSRGLAGLVIDGCVRDTAALAARAFPVWSAGVALTGATKNQPGTAGVAATVGGVAVEPGDWVVADGDGVVVVPAADLETVLAAGQARADKEARMFEQLQAGATTVDLLGLDPGPITGA